MQGKRDNKHDVFISYSHYDKDFVKKLCEYLEEHDIKCWMAPRDIPSGETYGGCIVRAIRETSVCLFVLSCQSGISRQCQKEIYWSLEHGKFIIPFKIDDFCLTASDDLAYCLSGCHFLEAFPMPEVFFASLLQHIRQYLNKTAILDEKQKALNNENKIDNREYKGWRKVLYTIKLVVMSGLVYAFPLTCWVICVDEYKIKDLLDWSICIIFLIGGIFATLGMKRKIKNTIQIVWQLMKQCEIKKMVLGYLKFYCENMLIFFGGICSFGAAAASVFVIDTSLRQDKIEGVIVLLFYMSCFFPGLAIYKTGEALLFENYSKFKFDKKRINKWLIRLAISLVLLIIAGALRNYVSEK